MFFHGRDVNLSRVRREDAGHFSEGMMKRQVMALLLGLVGVSPVTAQVKLTDQPGWVGALAFAPDGNALAIGTSDGSVRLATLGADRPIVKLKGHKDAVAALVFQSDGKALYSGGYDHVILRHSL